MLSLSSAWLTGEELPIDTFLGVAHTIAQLTRPVYGCAGRGGGLFGTQNVPTTRRDVHEARVPFLAWWNLFGPPYVEMFGRAQLLTAPAWRVEPLGSDLIAITISPHPDEITYAAALVVSQHLGVPLPPRGIVR